MTRLPLLSALVVATSLAGAVPTAAAPAKDKRGFKVVSSADDGESRLALVIGNSRYKSAPLKNPVRDAKLMAESLSDVGFEVDARFNMKRNAMLRAIRDFGDKLRERGGVGLFYFAGHGMQVDGRTYLIPVRADIRVEADVELEAVDATRILARMEEARNRLNLVVLDACRNNPIGRSVRSRQAGLAFLNAPTGTLISYATAPGQVAADGKGKNSYFTKALAKNLRTPGLRVEDVFKRVRTSVQKATKGQQTPWESSSLTGDFYFKFDGKAEPPKVAVAPEPEPEPQPQATAKSNDSAGVLYGPEPDEEQHQDLADASRLDREEPEDGERFTRRGGYTDLAGVAALETQLLAHRSVVNWTQYLGYLGWTVGGVGVLIVIIGVITAIGAAATPAGIAGGLALAGIGVALGCAGGLAGGGLCGTAYLFQTFADTTVGEIRAKDPGWVDNNNDGCSPAMFF